MNKDDYNTANNLLINEFLTFIPPITRYSCTYPIENPIRSYLRDYRHEFSQSVSKQLTCINLYYSQ